MLLTVNGGLRAGSVTPQQAAASQTRGEMLSSGCPQVGQVWEDATPWAHASRQSLKPAGFVASPGWGGCGCPTELHLSAFGRLSVFEPTHQPLRWVQGLVGTHWGLASWGCSNSTEQGGAGFLHWAQSLELAHSPAQHGALALPVEGFAGAAASHGPRTGPGSYREGNGTRILQWPGMLLFHRAAKDLVQPAPEAPASRTCQNRGDGRDIIFPYHSRFFT